MLEGIVLFFISALTIYMAGKYMTKVEVSSFGTAMLVALLIAVFGFLIGWLLTFVLNIATLGIFWLFGLSFIIGIVVNGIIIEIIDKFSSGFHTIGFLPSIWLAAILALVNAIASAII